MLSVFPQLFFLEQIAPFILRLALGAIFVTRGYRKLKGEDKSARTKVIIAIELGAGILLLVGFLTQIGAIVIALDRFGALWKNKFQNCELDFTLLIVAVSLIFLGPGILSVDLRF
ncbi:hypothetical protein A3H65_00350 [Candidatus Giovannonibacteria bacterium RIFCSPLOWO2_02_FULL_45_14]|uniref:Uncharacterized protein n=3 Tax=Parcubacteria group TaxID=1794811 RepID=A0A0H4TCK1_9BACT|nr:hypothetical protein [uncultured Parcubacteria bacterium Rifle_16ft_4_minimus_37658]AKQ05741.1 hypothetical protein [uncultured Parcubacteria bacterium Rifle_16ft_4_minimus_23641]OGF69268.1 MAG: hypothetical protein A3C75_03720 [Candidatus Giovannonibacteria bacterium RIFCSPHIGHO2_02_FULL_44_31]OGF76271.1 MAG: hypothetical protein A3E62_04025 [Candidatus Giovannonibacteria bacterium RIFCSPHIGHO2_12_FULL_44_29]OGF91165.1 MAG: hypothetical protein A3H65_00350 [Candidatus Giovannonibacteria bac